MSHSGINSGRLVNRSLKPDSIFFPEQTPQPLPLTLDTVDARHECPFSQSHHTFALDPAFTSNGVRDPLRCASHSRASSGLVKCRLTHVGHSWLLTMRSIRALNPCPDLHNHQTSSLFQGETSSGLRGAFRVGCQKEATSGSELARDCCLFFMSL